MRLYSLNSSWMVVSALCAAFYCGVGYAGAGPRTWTDIQDAGQQPDGRELFRTYCASCHGESGTGNGPVAASMRRTPPDITGLALANGGMFPTERMRRIIDGRDIEMHGDRDMPVWGDAFKSVRGGHSDEFVRARIAAILQYLISIQRRLA